MIHAQRLGAFVHLARKILLGARQALGDHDAGVVAGQDDDTLDQVFDRRAVRLVQEHGRTAHVLGAGGDREPIL